MRDRTQRRTTPPTMDELRLLGKVARLYHEHGIRQPEIAADLSMSQARVSRLLKQAQELGIVRTVVTLPVGVHTDLEESLKSRFDLRDAVVVDADGAGDDVLPALGGATATYLDVTLTSQHVLGVSSWSETLLSAVRRLPVKKGSSVSRVVQLVGGLGVPAVQVQATSLTSDLADRTGAQPIFFPAPGIVDTASVRRAMMKDRSVGEAVAAWDDLTDVLVGIGSIEPSPLLVQSGNALPADDLAELRRLGAVGDVCFRFFDEDGVLVRSEIDQRVVGIAPSQLLGVPRRIGVAGGRRKHAAIQAALAGGWVNVLITDLDTARHLTES